MTRDDGAGAVVVTVLDGAHAGSDPQRPVPSSAVPVATAMLADGRLAGPAERQSARSPCSEPRLETGSAAAAGDDPVDKDRGLLAAASDRGHGVRRRRCGLGRPGPTRVDVVDLDAATVAPFATLAGAAGRPDWRLGRRLGRTPAGAARRRVRGGARRGDGSTGGGDVGRRRRTRGGGAVDLGGRLGGWQTLLQPVGVPRLAAGRPTPSARRWPSPVTPGRSRSTRAAASSTRRTHRRRRRLRRHRDVVPDGLGGARRLPVVRAPRLRRAGHHPRLPARVRGPRPRPGRATTGPGRRRGREIARIDNHAGRTRLRSTAALQRTIECLLDSGGSGGAPGAPGKDGERRGRRDDGANGTDGTDGVNGTDGRDGEGLEKDLTQIVELSWKHADQVVLNKGT